jgi:hypothetical protein
MPEAFEGNACFETCKEDDGERRRVYERFRPHEETFIE